jgi:hypothetical protein
MAMQLQQHLQLQQMLLLQQCPAGVDGARLALEREHRKHRRSLQQQQQQ